MESKVLSFQDFYFQTFGSASMIIQLAKVRFVGGLTYLLFLQSLLIGDSLLSSFQFSLWSILIFWFIIAILFLKAEFRRGLEDPFFKFSLPLDSSRSILSCWSLRSSLVLCLFTVLFLAGIDQPNYNRKVNKFYW